MLEKQQTPLAQYIEEHANRSGYSYDEIGILCGFKTGNLIYAYARGEIRPPLDRIVILAEVLGCDSGQLFTLAIKEWFSAELFEQLQEAFLVYPSLEPAEADWLKTIREIFGGQVPDMNDRRRERLKLVMKTL